MANIFKKLVPERHLLVTLVVAIGWLMEQLDSTVLGTALPAISKSLHEDPVQLNLAITTYLISLAVFLPVSGWIADKFGPRLVFQAAMMIFAGASICCGLSNNLLELVGARVLQGFGGALMVPVGRLLVLRMVPKSDLVRAMAYLTTPAVLGPVLGPPVGGFFVTYLSWRWIFFFNFPIALAGVLLTARMIPNEPDNNLAPLDAAGAALSGIALAGLVFGFEVGARHALPTWMTAAMLGTGVVCTVAYAIHARHVINPIIDWSLYRIATVRASMVGGVLTRMGIGANPFLLPLLLQIGFGYTAMQSGMMTLVSGIGSMFVRPTARLFYRRFGFRRTMLVNTVGCSLFLLANAFFRPDTPRLVIYACLFMGGFCRSIQFTAVGILGYADVPQERLSRATSLNSILNQVSVSLGVGIAAILLHVSQRMHGSNELVIHDFDFAYYIVAAISLSALLSFLTLPRSAGADITGQKRRPANEGGEGGPLPGSGAAKPAG